MGQQQPITKVSKKRSVQEEARIEGLYEMYAQSMRLSTLMKGSCGKKGSDFAGQKMTKDGKKGKLLQNQENFLEELLISFEEKGEYSWGQEIAKLFKKHFRKGFEEKWYSSKEFFYQLLLENIGIHPQNHSLVMRSHLTFPSKSPHTKKPKQQIPSLQKSQQQTSFESHFHKIIKDRVKFNIKGSFCVEEDHIDRRKDEEITQIAEVESQRMTGNEDEIALINSSLIDAQEVRMFLENNQSEKQPCRVSKQENDDEYFLPLITKRNTHKNNKKHKLSYLLNPDQPFPTTQPTIEMSHFSPKAKYSRYRLESSSVILPSTIFYERMNFSAKVETDELLRIYRQLSNTIQQTINSCNLISCPLKHFLLYFEFKTSRKNIGQLSSAGGMGGSRLEKSNSSNDGDGSSLSVTSRRTSDSIRTIKKSQSIIIPTTTSHPSPSSLHQSNLPHPHQDLHTILTQVTPHSEVIRKKRQYNTNYLLKEIKEFAEAYTEFLFKYLNFMEIEQTDLENFVNLDTVYGIVLRNVWNILSWIAERGFEWEEHVAREVVDRESPNLQVFSEDDLARDPTIILHSYAKFCNKQPRKIKTEPAKLVKAYLSLLKLKHEVFPQKYLKKIIIFYRQATKCCEGADDLMSLYEFLLKVCIVNGFTQDMHIFRMKNIIDKLIPIESSAIDGAGEIVYAWTTWNIALEMLLMKLNEHKQVLLAECQEKQNANKPIGFVNQTEKKKPSENVQTSHKKQKNPSTDTRKPHSQQISEQNYTQKNQNPERKPQKKLQF